MPLACSSVCPHAWVASASVAVGTMQLILTSFRGWLAHQQPTSISLPSLHCSSLSPWAGYRMAIDSIPPAVFTLLQLAIPTMEDAPRLQPQKCFAPIARRLEAYSLEQCKDEFRGVLTTGAGKRHDDHSHLACLAALRATTEALGFRPPPPRGSCPSL